ncbi:DNA-binding transcriptional regulator LsrR, DeoR family [Thermoanaerobacter uzonensis DSM 18761]|uniref:DNA-binding transcriptional regulator LsrR, DeoR family n=1 Tax=Thermoanaerobacter uzonensis DSM 18761 TaxID=1123369 RepID=A0A1M4XWP6_9THEO|nr:sugar-binding transcriptional regulator [Thermoanaerobacter uzonensis]SHE97662.1 DNA-binding transcriptional regulator LsrR, DeoR family [Thermoanaerobacter uzonensis DSM 18761]
MEENIRLLIKVALLYYNEKLTEQEISARLGISRPKVSRLLKKALEIGIVEIKINTNNDLTSMEKEIEKKYKLQEVKIVEYKTEENELLKKELGKAAAELLVRIIKNGDIIGVSWGTTIALIPQFIKINKKLNTCLFVPLVAGLGQAPYEIQANNIAIEFAKAFGAKWQLLHAPAIVENLEVKKSILSDSMVKKSLEIAAKADVAIVGIGGPINTSTILESGYFGENEINELNREGAIGDICSRFFDINGNICERAEINNRIIGISLEQLKQIKRVVGVAGGKNKIQAIKSALKGGYINILVTDTVTAEELLKD